MPRACALVVAALLLCVPAAARADTTIDFETPGPGTTITNQYQDVGGPGQGVVFGPLPGGGDGLRPVIKSVAMGSANSGTQVADISNCFTCEFYVPNTVGTFQVPRTKVSVHVGYDGPPGPVCPKLNQTASQCARITLTAYDSDGSPVGTPSSATVTEGAGFHTLLSVEVPSPTIVGFRVSARTDSTDDNKPIAIDDLSFDVPVTPSPPDFTVTPADTLPVMGQGQTLTDAISLSRLSGSSGSVQLSLSGDLPRGVTASFDPNPATGGQSVLTFTTAPDSDTTGFNPIPLTITGTPTEPSAGDRPHSATINLQVRSPFDLTLHGLTDVDVSTCSVDVPVEVDRDFSFPGPVSLSVTGMTGGVQASFAPAQATFPNGSRGQTVPLTVRAPATGVAVPPQTLTIHASAPPLADRTATITVHGTCPEQYDARVTSLQITQGVQADFLPAQDPARHPPNQFNYSQIPSAAKLRGGGPTIVRVYADETFGPTGGVPGVPAALYGASYDRLGQLHALPGSPILPVNGTRDLVPGPATATTAEERGEKAAYSFVLPPSWTHGEIAINAILQPTTGTVSHTLTPCHTDQCVLDDSMGLTHIPFLEAPPVTIRPVQLTVSGRPALPDAQQVFAFARAATPLDLAVQPYAGTIDITDLADTFTACDTAARAAHDDQKASDCSDQANDDGAERMDDWTCDNGTPSNGWNIGVNTGVARGLTKTDVCVYQLTAPQNAVVEVNRPLTSVTHEFFHLLGRPHASSACGGGSNGQTAESWPPDEVGYINGIGLDTAMNSGINGGPFAIIAGAPPFNGNCASSGDCGGSSPQERFDLMSYCAFDTPDPIKRGSAWISLRNWNDVLEDHRFHKPVVAAVANGPPSLRVGAFLSPNGSVTITSVAPLAAASQAQSSSAYHLVGSDASGRVVADVPMLEGAMHVDGEQPPIPLVGAIPSAGVVKVAIVKEGVALASRARSASAPTIALTGLPTFHKSGATVRWKAADADGDALQAAVDYSADGGKTFHRIFIGPDKSSAAVPARYLSRSSKARVRVTVNDGFQSASATSRRFRSPGAPPDVSILSPASGLRQPDDAPLVLSGQAFDDTGKMLTGKRLRWTLGRRLLGRGRSIAATGLKPGRRRISLVARDHFGRTGRRSVVVVITGARPLFLTLKAPRSVKRKARSIRLTVSSSLPARLGVHAPHSRAQRFSVGRRSRALRVRIARGAGSLHLRLSLTSGRKSTTRTVVIRRS